jgi:ferredoxin--NADP+ reductase
MGMWHSGIVVENKRLTERLTSLKIDAPLDTFQAGQFVRVGLEIDGKVVARPYSLVNAPTESPLEFYFNIVEGGPLSPHLFNLKAGDDVLVASNPNGFLIIDEIPKTSNLWMMATGTAIGPFLSILKCQPVWEKFEQVVLCYSVRTEKELAYLDLIAELEKKHAGQFTFVPLVTREDVPGALRMRIPAAIEKGIIEHRTSISLTADSAHVMMCGSADMIKDVVSVLELRGMQRHRRRDPGHYTTEKYH